jgi:flagellar hook-associated protein 2
MSISFGSINTGLPPNIVEQLVEAEKIPIKNMERQKEKTESRLKLVEELQTKIGDIRKGLSELANTRGFADIKLITADQNVVQGTVDPATYQPGSWNIEVVEMPQKSSAVTNGFPDKDKTSLGVGYLRFKTPDGTKDVYINAQNSTLDGAAKAINSAQVGVRATVLNDRADVDNPFKLVLSADGLGADKSVEYPRIYMLDGDRDLYFDKEVPGKNGILKVDGFEFQVAETTLKEIIPGVTLELKAASPGKQVNITVKEDLELVSGKIKTFVDGMNGVLAFVQQQNKMDRSTDTTRTLGGDGMVRNVEQRLRSLVQAPQFGIRGPIKTLSQVGIQFNRSGTLEFDQKKFDSTLASNPAAVQEFFVGDGFATGFVNSVKREIGNLLNPNIGPVANRAKGLKDKVSSFDDRIAQKERQLQKREEMLRAKFTRLEETMSKLKAQGGQMSAALAGATGGGAGGG